MGNSKVPSIAIKKLKRVSVRQLGGYLTAAEYFMALKLYSPSITPTSNDVLDFMQRRIESGVGGGMWVYFNTKNKKVAEAFEKSPFYYG